MRPRLFDELIPAAPHITEQYANNSVEADHGRLKARLRPMRGLHTFRSARNLTAACLYTHAPPQHRLRAAFDQLVPVI